MAIQADGKIVVGGYSTNSTLTNLDFALARFNSNGTLDTSFDLDGKLSRTFGSGDDVITSLAIQANGKIVVGGYTNNGANTDFALARFNADGSFDTTFDTDGRVTTARGNWDDYINSVVLQADGKIVVAGSSYNGKDADFAFVRQQQQREALDTTDTMMAMLTMPVVVRGTTPPACGYSLTATWWRMGESRGSRWQQ